MNSNHPLNNLRSLQVAKMPRGEHWKRPSDPGQTDRAKTAGNGARTGPPSGTPQPLLAPPPTTIKLLVADDHPVVLAGLAGLLAGRKDINIVDQARNGREAVEKFLAIRPDVGLFEVRMPVMSGIEAVTTIREQVPNARLLMFTTCQSEEDVYRAVRAGAQGYVSKNAPVEELVQSICTVATGQQWIPLAAAAQLARRIADRELTVREREVLLAITSGKSNKEIGVALSISEATVKVHVTHILEKLKASGRTEAIRLAVQRGLVYMDAPGLAA